MELPKEQQAKMQKLVAGLKVKAEKIRVLDREGFGRSAIARFLEIRYQHVRNVLVRAEKKRDETAESTSRLRVQEWASIGIDGRVVIPQQYRQHLGIEAGGHVLMLLEQDEVRLIGRNAAVRRAQELVARYVPDGTRLTEELFAERRAEAARDDHK